MAIIPNNLHFLTSTELISYAEVRNIIAWVNENPMYTCVVWANFADYSLLQEDFFELLGLEPNVSSIREAEVGNEKWVRWSYHEEPRILVFRHIGTIMQAAHKYLTDDLSAVFDKQHVFRDIASLVVLVEHGGVCVDTQTRPVGTVLPVSIQAPDRLLFDNPEEDRLTNLIVASSAGDTKAIALMLSFEAEYKKYYRLTLPVFYQQGVVDEILAQEGELAGTYFTEAEGVGSEFWLTLEPEERNRLMQNQAAQHLASFHHNDGTYVLNRFIKRQIQSSGMTGEEEAERAMYITLEAQKIAQGRGDMAELQRLLAWRPAPKFSINSYSFQKVTGCQPRTEARPIQEFEIEEGPVEVPAPARPRDGRFNFKNKLRRLIKH